MTGASETPLRLAAAIRYRREAPQIELHAALVGRAGVVALRDVDAVAGALASLTAADGASCLALYGLQLAADTQGDLALAADALRRARPGALRMAEALEQALQRPGAETPGFGQLALERATAADRAAERCGRRAAELIDGDDIVAADPSCGLALDWMLQQAQQSLGASVQVRQASAGLQAASLLLIGAESLALDGSALVLPAVAACLADAAQRGLPRYLVAPSGPGTLATQDAERARRSGLRVAPPAQISAIVTDRGLYRPAMLARYLGDGDAPLDVIPLR